VQSDKKMPRNKEINQSDRICLIVDNPLRDLEGMVLVALHLAAEGKDVFLVPMYQSYEVFAIYPDFVLVNYIRDNNDAFIRRCIDAGIAIGVLDTEGGVLQDYDGYYRTIFGNELSRKLDLYCFWGLKQFETAKQVMLEKNVDYQQSFLQVTGCPRYDFCFSPWRDALTDVAFTGTKYVLINTNFQLVQPRYQTAEQEIRNLIDSYGWDKEYLDELACQTKIAFKEVVKAIKHLATAIPGLSYVVRPHPFEDRSVYDKEFHGYQNVHVYQERSVLPWIRNALVVLHHNCSTSVESVLMDKLPVDFAWIKTPLLDQPVPKSISVHANSPEELESIVKKISNDGTISLPSETSMFQKKIIREWFYSDDGRSGERTARAVNEVINGKQHNKTKHISSIMKSLLLIPLLKRNFKEVLKYSLLLSLKTKIYNKIEQYYRGSNKMKIMKSKEFSVEETRAIVKRIGKVTNGFDAIRVIQANDEHTVIKGIARHSVLLRRSGSN